MMQPKKQTKSFAKLKLLHRRRTNVLGSATLIKSFNDQFDPAQTNQLSVRIQRLDELWRDFEGIQDEIEVLEEAEEQFSEERRNFQDLYYELKASLESKLPTRAPAPTQPPPVDHGSSSLGPPVSHVRLPEIKLKEFSGSFDDWISFRDLFTSLIHSNRQLSGVQKMHYLRATLTGEAARIISSLELSANNYTVAWTLLKERFENPNFLIKRHMSGLLAITPLKKESSSGLAELADEFDRHVQLLDKLETAENHWNSFLIERLSSYLDPISLREWETQISDAVRPTYKQLLEFVHKRSRIMQTLKLSQNCSTQSESKSTKPRLTVSHVASEHISKCRSCKQAHLLFQCDQFRKLTPQHRFEFVKKHGLCINCLKGTHLARDCSSGSCKSCAKKNHSLLHLPPIQPPQANVTSAPACNQTTSAFLSQPAEATSSQSCQLSQRLSNRVVTAPLGEYTQSVAPVSLGQSSFRSNPHSYSVGIPPAQSSVDFLDSVNNSPPSPSCQSAELSASYSTVILSTAVIKVKDINNVYHYARALLDSGSQPSFITEALCQKLNLKRVKLNSPVSGIGQSTVTVHFGVALSLASRFGGTEYNLDCLVLPKLTVSLPSHHIDVTRWRIPRNLPLADPQFNISRGVDMIIGAELFFALLENQQVTLATGYPLLQKTVLGFIVCGKVTEPASNPSPQTSHICTEESLDAQLERFWEIENLDDGKAYTSEEQLCEEHFQETVARDFEGRYIVRLPLREELMPLLGDSYSQARRRLLSIERKFAADDSLRQEYKKFMEDYERLGHMESSTTKTRVVFDGSCRGSTQLSLNDVLFTGPTVQPTLYSTVVNFRRPQFVVTADVEKMFRQIWIHPDDRKFQQILWRNDPSEPIRTYQLKTVTYGLASSPYHATRVLDQLATDEGERFPLAVPIIRKGTYVDDVLTGHDDLYTLKEACTQLMEMLKRAGLVLRKWASNDTAVLSSVPPNLWETSKELEIDRSPAVKTLGLLWFPSSDTFKFKIPQLPDLEVFTKRIVASEMASLFDPHGLLGPVVVNAKMFMQTLWAEKLPWDEQLSEVYNTWWKKYRSEISKLQSLEIPRRVMMNNKQQYSLHCFCDASKKGYGCSVYVVSQDDTRKLYSRLLTSKSRVAPLRGQSIPRLELCAALLGSQLVDIIQRTTEFTEPATFWTDSTVVLHWLKSQSHNWKVFVSNRIAEIQRLTKGCRWRHIPTEMNPADRISRGMMASQILDDMLWWHGPKFLYDPVEKWPELVVSAPDAQDFQEEAGPVVALHTHEVDSSLVDRFSDLGRLINAVARCYRFCHNTRTSKDARNTDTLSSEETNNAFKALIRLAQEAAFPREIRLYQRTVENAPAPSKFASTSPLKNLNLFMDSCGLLRIDGRLKNMKAPYDTRFPILLPSDHKLSWLIARSLHLRTLHSGPTLLLATIRQRFWPLRGRQLARRVVHKCVTCFRCRPQPTQQMMAPLPAVRVTPARAFAYSGMDYCGPFFVRPLSGRGASVKIYVSLFVCLVVKAVHLEVVADLTSVACINAVKRFVARRGRVIELHCDNATAFVGADRELRALRQAFLQQFNTGEWKHYCQNNGINFRFIPPRSPHFGGIWEAGIKSFKFHFRRIMGNNSFTMDQLLTAVTQIESMLNSRPLTPLSDSPEDISALTPGHFLIGEPLFSIPEPDLNDLNPNRLSRLQEMKRAIQDLWRRWSRDYISQLHQRTKWKQPSADVRIGQLVLLKQDNTPPLQWPLARIVGTVKGKDGRVRVVIVRTASRQFKRGITEISVLPIDPDQDDRTIALFAEQGEII